MKGFDGQFVVRWMIEQGTAPEIIPCGSKIMSVTHKTLNIKMIDSYNFLPMGLSKLPACFGLEELKKGFFPHLFNIPENQNYIGCLPSIQYYTPDSMATSVRKDFLKWHSEHANDIFDFEREMLAYCRSDVDILRRCCLEFQKQFIDVTEVDPFRYITIASACMAVYRAHHIKSNTIAMVPIHGYVNRTIYSPDSIRWMDYIADKESINIQHALNGTGEKVIQEISVDGYCSSTNTIYQYHGCFFHGCNFCYDGDIMHPLKNVTMATIKLKTENNIKKLQDLGYTIVEMWEHNFLEMKKKNPELKEFLKTHSLEDRLNPRDAFFGGRTNALKLYHEGDTKYVDFTSLYPWVNKYCAYPVGHPKIITKAFQDIENYFGIIKCKVIPPRGLYLPVLPYRCNKKLMFPLCRCCADSMQQNECMHTDEERSIIGTWVSEEIKLAISKGYRVAQIYEVYNFEEKSDCLFKSYIDLFLKIKQESSGWPINCATHEEKMKYIKEYEDREGIKLDITAISKNPGRRQVAKLALNSFWGRWGMNCNKTQLTYVDSVPRFNKMLSDSTKKIKDIYLTTPEVVAIQWEAEKDFISQDKSTNIFIAAFTTSWARIKLYSEMELLGESVLYHDTDSIIYATDGTNDPPLGYFLGEFTDELNGDTITSFVSGGAKNYAFKTSSGKTVCKVRGFTLNFANSCVLNYNSMLKLVSSMDKEEETVAVNNPRKIVREAKKRKVVNKEEKKVYKVVYNKRVLRSDLTTIPYGY